MRWPLVLPVIGPEVVLSEVGEGEVPRGGGSWPDLVVAVQLLTAR